MNFRRHPKTLLAAAILAATGAPQVAFTQDSGADIEEVVVTGARGRPRTVSDSPVPIDVFSADEIRAISHTDTNNVLQTLVPSFNVARQPSSTAESPPQREQNANRLAGSRPS